MTGRPIFLKRSLWRVWSAALGAAVGFVVRSALRSVGK